MEKTAVLKKPSGLWYWLTPVFLLVGLCGIWCLLSTAESVTIFWLWPVLIALLLLVPFGWMLEKRRKWVKWGLLLGLAVLGLAFWLCQTDLLAQFPVLYQSIIGGRVEPTDVTGAVTFLTAAVTWIMLLCLWAKLAWLVWILITLLLVAPTLIGFFPPLPTVFCLAVFQVAFAALVYGRRRSRRRKVVLQGKNSGLPVQKSGLSVAVLALVMLLAGLLVVNWFGEPLYYFTGLVQYRASQLQQIVLPFSARSTVTNSGVINRGNLFPSGQELLAAYTDNPPTETIYLKGFTGGDYQGGSWAEVNESQLFQRVEQQMGDGWSSRGSGVFRFLYYNLNQWTQREDAPLPRNLTLRGIYGKDSSWYPPYYYYYNNSYETQDGYRFSYYQASDVHLDWDSMDPEQAYNAQSYRRFQEYYQEQALEAYTQVPEDLVPQLTQYCRDNPQGDLDSIISFIRNTLFTHIRYTSTPGQIPINEDPVEYTVFESHMGYCQHFASAAVLMFRLYGIPARYVSGYSVNPGDFDLQEDGSYRASITDNDAHAWPEIFLEDYGWVPIEVTFVTGYTAPAEEETTVSSETSSQTTSSTSSATSQTSELSTSSLLEGDASNSQENLGDSGLPVWFWWIFGGVLAVMVLVLVLLLWRAMRLARRKASFRTGRRTGSKKLSKWMHKLLDKLRGLGITIQLPYWMRRGSKGVREEWSRMLRVLRFGGFWEETEEPAEEYFCRHPETNPFLSREEMLQVLDLVGQAAYGKAPLTSEQLKFVQKAYLRTAKGVYQTLPWYQKIWLKWFWVAF